MSAFNKTYREIRTQLVLIWVALTFWYQAEKSASFLTPIAICTAPSIFGSSFSLTTGFGAGPSVLRAAKSTSSILTASVSRLLRYVTMSFPDKNRVELEEHAWIANVAEEDAMEASITVTTLEKVSLFNAKSDTAIDGIRHCPGGRTDQGTHASSYQGRKSRQGGPPRPNAVL